MTGRESVTATVKAMKRFYDLDAEAKFQPNHDKLGELYDAGRDVYDAYRKAIEECDDKKIVGFLGRLADRIGERVKAMERVIHASMN